MGILCFTAVKPTCCIFTATFLIISDAAEEEGKKKKKTASEYFSVYITEGFQIWFLFVCGDER